MPEPDGRRRVLLVIAGLPAGGAERQMALLARGLDRTRFIPGLLIFGSARKVHYREVLEEVPWFRALELSGSSAARLLIPLLRGISSAVRDFEPDIVHASLNVANHAVRMTAILNRWKMPVVTSVRNDFRQGYRRSERAVERLLWRRSANIICNSEHVRAQLLADLGCPPDRVVAIPNGIDERFFADTEGVRPEGWPTGRTALCVSRFTAQKNPLDLIRAFAALGHDSDVNGWNLVFVGEGPLAGEMHETIKQTGNGCSVTVMPAVTDVQPLYRASEIVILPSKYEGMSNVCLEAAASGRPLLLSQGAGAEALIAAGGGWRMGDSPTDMRNGLAAALRKSSAELHRAGGAGRAFVKRNYRTADMVGRTMALYDALGRHP